MSPDTLYGDLIATISRKQAPGPFLIMVGALGSYFVLSKVPGSGLSFIHYFAAILGAILTLSGIVMMFMQMKKEAALAEGTPLSVSSERIEHAVTQLNKNYTVLRRQTTQGFILSGVFMILGFLVIASGSVGELFGWLDDGSDLTSVAGIIIEFISGTALFVYSSNFKRLNEISDRLDETWRILTAHRLTESLSDEGKEKATLSLIEALAKSPKGN